MFGIQINPAQLAECLLIKNFKLIDELQNQIGIESYGNEIISVLKECFKEGDTIQNATFKFIHSLFASYGLIVLIPDHSD
jgi:bacillithiol synthase